MKASSAISYDRKRIFIAMTFAATLKYVIENWHCFKFILKELFKMLCERNV
jgi:hypothetical protein